jgi:anaerobic selenocysteine-containing dehydrogenase
MDVRRRTFLKTAALAAVGSALPGCQRQTDRLIPYLLPDDEIVPGVADWYASVCSECRAGCGVLVRVREGRAKKIEGNPEHPVNQGKLCAWGQASLQGLYNPDRAKQPLQRKGARGEGLFIAIDWEEGLQRCTEALRARQHGPIMISRPLTGTMSQLLADFMDALGGQLYYYAPDAELPLSAAWQESVGTHLIPPYDLAQADYLLSFGAPLLEHWISPVAMGIAFGQMRQGRPTTRGRFVHIEPRMSLTAANADRWIPIRPGTEGLLALGIGQVMLADHRLTWSSQQRARFQEFYHSVDLQDVAKATDVPTDVVARLAHEFASARAPLAIGGGTACAHTNGTLSLIAINGLNAMVGNLGREKSVGMFPDQDRIAWLTEQAVIDLLKQQEKTGAHSSLLLYDSNPLFTMAPSVPMRRLFEQAPFIVSFSAFMDESTETADLVLPDRTSLESWGDHVAETPVRALGLSQPAVMPLYDARQLGDTILDLGRRMGFEGFQWPTFHDLLRQRWRALLESQPHDESSDWFDKAWEAHLQRGGWWPERGTRLRPLPFAPSRGYESAVLSGDEKEFPFIFYPYPSMTVGHGEGANRPWLQELPDTMTTVVWGSWVEVNPNTAKSLHIQQGDVVRVTSPFGSLEAPAVLFPGLRPEVLAMPMGQGHSSYGRYARRRGANPVQLLAPALDSVTGTLASGATRVRMERTGVKGRLVTVERPVMEPSDLITISRSRES